MLTTIGFDADDTLWQNECFFRLTQEYFVQILADYAQSDQLLQRLLAAERRNLGHYGFGVKGFTLSMIETAVEVTQGRVSGKVIGEILAAGRQMLEQPAEILPHAREAIAAVAAEYRVVLITKGDLLDQERKLAHSGLGDLFQAVEIVSDKTTAIYRAIFTRHGTGADQGMMVGNSMKSDVLPMIAAGGWGVHVPHEATWALESAEPPQNNARFHILPDLSDLPDLVDRIANSFRTRADFPYNLKLNC